jgi:hypothetical protein
MRRTARAKRFAGYQRVLIQYRKLGYIGAEIHFRAFDRDIISDFPELRRWTVKCLEPADAARLRTVAAKLHLRYRDMVCPQHVRARWELLSVHLGRYAQGTESSDAALSAMRMVHVGEWKVAGITDSGLKFDLIGSETMNAIATGPGAVFIKEIDPICRGCGSLFLSGEELCSLCGDPR